MWRGGREWGWIRMLGLWGYAFCFVLSVLGFEAGGVSGCGGVEAIRNLLNFDALNVV